MAYASKLYVLHTLHVKFLFMAIYFILFYFYLFFYYYYYSINPSLVTDTIGFGICPNIIYNIAI